MQCELLLKILISVFLKEFPETQTRTLSLATLTYLTIQPLPTLHSTSKYSNQAFKRLHDLMEFNTLNNIEVSSSPSNSDSVTSQRFLQLVSGLVSTWLCFVSQVIKDAIKAAFCRDERTPHAARFPYHSMRLKTRSSWNEISALQNDTPNR